MAKGHDDAQYGQRSQLHFRGGLWLLEDTSESCAMLAPMQPPASIYADACHVYACAVLCACHNVIRSGVHKRVRVLLLFKYLCACNAGVHSVTTTEQRLPEQYVTMCQRGPNARLTCVLLLSAACHCAAHVQPVTSGMYDLVLLYNSNLSNVSLTAWFRVEIYQNKGQQKPTFQTVQEVGAKVRRGMAHTACNTLQESLCNVSSQTCCLPGRLLCCQQCHFMLLHSYVH
jgi:hypothetical protein